MSPGLRIGAIVPSSNPVVEPEFRQLTRELREVEVLASRLHVASISLDEQSASQFSDENFAAAASLLHEVHPDVVVWAGTSGSWLGRAHEERVVDTIEQTLGVPATTSTFALIEACRAYSATKIHLVSPYVEEVVAKIVPCYADFGIEVVSEAHLGITENAAFAAVPSEDIRSLAASAAPEAHAVIICCTNLHAAALVADLESEIGRPVFDSVSTTLWGAFSLRQTADTVHGWGTLLAQGTRRARLNSIAGALLEVTEGDRVTVQVSLAQLGLSVDRPVAEAHRPGIASIANDASIDQRRLETIVWLDEKPPDLSFSPVSNPHLSHLFALRQAYGVQAQMLGPIERAGQLIGWLSVHQLNERVWRGSDVAALEQACGRALDALESAIEP